MKTHRWEDIRGDLDEEAVERERQEVVREHLEFTLSELRKARGLTQTELARQLDRSQPSVSALERQGDVLLSSLREYVNALGGRLEVRAVFDDDVTVNIPVETPADNGDGGDENAPVRLVFNRAPVWPDIEPRLRGLAYYGDERLFSAVKSAILAGSRLATSKIPAPLPVPEVPDFSALIDGVGPAGFRMCLVNDGTQDLRMLRVLRGPEPGTMRYELSDIAPTDMDDLYPWGTDSEAEDEDADLFDPSRLS